MDKVYKVYWYPGAKEVGVFSSELLAHKFIYDVCNSEKNIEAEYQETDFEVTKLDLNPTVYDWY